MKLPLFYRPKPAFGLDIGRSSVKAVEMTVGRRGFRIKGYGHSQIPPETVENGIIKQPEVLAGVIKRLLTSSLVGDISSKRVIVSLPIANAYTRVLDLPILAGADISEAVRLEAEQYIPVPSKDLYLEHHVLATSRPTAKNTPAIQKVLMIAVPKRIVDSILEVLGATALEVVVIEPNMFANLRVINYNQALKGPLIVIDFGAKSSDLAIYDSSIQLVSTIASGGEDITAAIAKTLKVAVAEAEIMKTQYGIGKSPWQAQLASALTTILSDFANEVQKLMRYYHEHSGGQVIAQIGLVGGGANLPGLTDFLAHLTGVDVKLCNPWQRLDFAGLRQPKPTETTIYTTAIGLALNQIKP